MPSERVGLAVDGAIGPPRGDEPRPVRRPRRLSSGAIVPIVLAVLAATFAYAALQDRSAMVRVVVASAFVPAGSPLGPADSKVVPVHESDGPEAHGLLSPAQLSSGWVAAVPLRPGELLTSSEVARPSPAALGQMSIAVPIQQAAGGEVAAGDEVDVIATNSSGGAYYVAQGLRVLSVAPTGGAQGVLGASTGSYYIVVSVGKQVALRLAAALGAESGTGLGGAIEVVRSTGEAATPELQYSPGTAEGAAGAPSYEAKGA